jgi:hypothetical protein
LTAVRKRMVQNPPLPPPAGDKPCFTYYNIRNNSSDLTKKPQNCKTAEPQNLFLNFPLLAVTLPIVNRPTLESGFPE